MPGKLIVIEGLDGSGKSTQVARLKQRLLDAGISVRQIKLPDYDDPSSTLVRMYLGGAFGENPSDVNIFATSAFYAVDRYASFHRHWKEDYTNGTLILADRYTTSNAVHQTVKLPKEQWPDYIEWLCDFEYNKMQVPRPDRVIYLDMPVEISQRLMSARYGGDEVKKDVHEANVAYLRQCREAAAFAAEKMGWDTISCAGGENPLPIETISDSIYAIVKQALKI